MCEKLLTDAKVRPAYVKPKIYVYKITGENKQVITYDSSFQLTSEEFDSKGWYYRYCVNSANTRVNNLAAIGITAFVTIGTDIQGAFM